MLMPIACTISRLLAPARMAMPMRVRAITTYSASATAMQTADMNNR